MSQLQPTFDLVLSGTGLCPKELWIDLGSIPSGSRVWFGFASLISEDKDMQFALRSNLTGQSAGTLVATQLHDYAAVQTGGSVDKDFYKGGMVTMMSVVSTGVEHWWLRCTSGSATVGNLDYIFYYAVY